jgi:hypothetical protein
VIPRPVVLSFLLILLAVGLWFPPERPPHQNKEPGGDLVLFRAVTERVRSGEPYYDVMRAELRNRGYPTASIFNWRAPATFLLLAKAPAFVHVLMLAFGVLAIILTFFVFRSAPRPVLIASILLQVGASAVPLLPIEGLYWPELWAGIFLVLSVLTYIRGGFKFGVCFAIAAVCARELALPYVLAAIGFALYSRRWQEVRWYAVGLAIFLAYYAAHVVAASSHIQPGDMSHTRSWIAFGGWPFVVTTVKTGGWLLLLPRWTAAIGAVIVVASLWGPSDRHLKAMVIIYLTAFSVVGQSFNNSWGLLTGPAWGLAMAYGIIGLDRLIRPVSVAQRPTSWVGGGPDTEPRTGRTS